MKFQYMEVGELASCKSRFYLVSSMLPERPIQGKYAGAEERFTTAVSDRFNAPAFRIFRHHRFEVDRIHGVNNFAAKVRELPCTTVCNKFLLHVLHVAMLFQGLLMLSHNIQAQDWHSMSVMWRWLTAIGMNYLRSSPMNTIRDNCLIQEQ